MAKKAELLEKAAELKIEADESMTIAQIEELIAEAENTEVQTEESAPETTQNDNTDDSEEETFAKAGKRSAKSAREADEEAEKEARKLAIAEGEIDPSGEGIKKGPKPVARPAIERRSKRYRQEHESIDKTKAYSSKDAIETAVKASKVKFDASVEIHYNLGVDPKQADQNIRGTVALPNGTGKKIVVAVLCEEDGVKAAKAAGADFAGEEVMAKITKSELDFDVLIAIPKMMPTLGKFARELGPRGLMPSPKSGTVSPNPAEAVTAAKAGQVEYRVDKQGNIHCNFGKVSFGVDKLVENLEVIDKQIREAKPSSIKGNYINTIYITTTMGPSIKVAV